MTDVLRPPPVPSEAAPASTLEANDPDVGSGEAPIIDPYLAAPPPPPVRAKLSGLAVSALVVAFLGPVGAILAIVFGWSARQEIQRCGSRRAGHGLATAGLVLGVVLTIGWGGGLSYIAWTLQHRADPAGDEPAAVPPPPPEPAPQAGAAPSDPIPLAPKQTHVGRTGAITVVDLGSGEASLSEALAKQRAEATTAGEKVLVMTTVAGCEPCRGVDAALSDPRLQTALAKVRLVRVDVRTFGEELEQLRMPISSFPWFFLLAPDLTPRDGINGGEWDEDIPINIAPVLTAFVREKYPVRRERWRPAPATGVTL